MGIVLVTGLVVVFLAVSVAVAGSTEVEFLVGLKENAAVPGWPEAVSRVKRIPGSRVHRVWAPSARAEEALRCLRRMEEVAFVERARQGEVQEGADSDSLDNQAWYEVVKVSVLAELGDGAGVVVAVLDTGVDLDIPGVSGIVWRNRGEVPDDGLDNDGNGYVDDSVGWDFGDQDNDPRDENGHGTQVSSIALAIAPRCTILPVKINQDGSPVFGTGELVEGIFYAMGAGARVINLSLTVAEPSEAVTAALRAARQAGALVVAAAGNNGVVEFPATLPEVIAVGSLYGLEPAWFSPQGPELDLTAPGVQIETINLSGVSSLASGTSFSAAIVSGAAAILRSMNPHLTPDTVRNLLLDGSLDLGEPGRDPLFGAGALDGSSLRKAAAPRVMPPTPPFHLYRSGSPLNVSIHLPRTDTRVEVFVGLEAAGSLFWLDSAGMWHNAIIDPLASIARGTLDAGALDLVLFGDDGVFPVFETSSLPPGSYSWVTALVDEDGRIVGPVTRTNMYLY
jgi:subtilisin family serine protease